jgi:oligosaccharide translocation protein RFT1
MLEQPLSLNQALLSYTTPAAFGTATIQLEPLLNTVLFLCREGIRGALARQSKHNVSSRTLTRLSLLPLGLGLPVSLAGFYLYLRNTSPAVYNQAFFGTSVTLYALATLVELASEPFFNRAQLEMDIRLRVSIEGSAVIARAVATLLFVVYGKERMALLAFGAGQLVYAAILLVRYSWHYRGREIAIKTGTDT